MKELSTDSFQEVTLQNRPTNEEIYRMNQGVNDYYRPSSSLYMDSSEQAAEALNSVGQVVVNQHMSDLQADYETALFPEEDVQIDAGNMNFVMR